MNKPNSEEWKLVYTTSTEHDAYLVKGMLENEEIPVQILSQIDTTRQFNIGGLAIAKLYVLKSDYDTAKKLIEETQSK
jgi:hypothetical protein